MDTSKKVSFPIRMDEKLKAQLDKAVELTGLSLQDISRLCLQIGLADLRRINFDLGTAIANQAHAIEPAEPANPTPPKVVDYRTLLKAEKPGKVAETPPPPKSARSK